MSLESLLQQHCIVDTSLLSNFVFTGQAHLLSRVTSHPIWLPPAVLDPNETLISRLSECPRSEFLKPLYEVLSDSSVRYASVAPYIQAFAVDAGQSWNAVDLTERELDLAIQLSERSIWNQTTGVSSKFKRRGLGPGEAEACAIAILRNWTLLVDDQPAIELLKGLGHNVSTIRTCQLFKYCVDIGLIECQEAMRIFNEEIVDRYGFHATRNKGTERLWFRCDPPRCEWVEG